MDTRSDSRAILLLIILSNLIPLMGVLFYGWDMFGIVFLYWIETAIIGFYNVLRMTLCANSWREKVLFIPFFIIHFYFFIIIQLIFILFAFAPFRIAAGAQLRSLSAFAQYLTTLEIYARQHLAYGIVSILTSYGAGFYVHDIRHGDARRARVKTLMAAPYLRVFVQQFIAIVGSGAVHFFSSGQVAVVALLILFKTFVSLRLYQGERAVVRAASSIKTNSPA